MMFPVLFAVLTLLFLLFFYWGTGRNKSVLTRVALWIALVSILAQSGFFQNTNTTPPRFVLVLAGNLVLVLYALRALQKSRIDLRIALGIHALRVPVELALYVLFLKGQVPEIMTFKGWNHDIWTGISAAVLLVAMVFFNFQPSKKLLLGWNIAGLLLLANIVVIAILAAPLPIQQLAFDQPNVAVLAFPYILLPSVIVPLVLVTHVVSIRQLLRKD
jgi:hypothetical protein